MNIGKVDLSFMFGPIADEYDSQNNPAMAAVFRKEDSKIIEEIFFKDMGEVGDVIKVSKLNAGPV